MSALDSQLFPSHVQQISAWIDSLTDEASCMQRTVDLFSEDVALERFSRCTSGRDRLVGEIRSRLRGFHQPALTHSIVFYSPHLVVAHYKISGLFINRIGDLLPTGAAVWSRGLAFFFCQQTPVELRSGSDPFVSKVRDDWDTIEIAVQLGILVTGQKYHDNAHRSGADRNTPFPVGAHLTSWARELKLSPRLAQVGAFLLTGAGAAKIASALELSLSSLRTYVRNLYAATNVHSQSEFTQRVGEICGFTETHNPMGIRAPAPRNVPAA
jgi:DNA-binding CsgD family transcriptional regulator